VHLDLLLDMAVSGHGSRVAFGPRDGGLTGEDLAARSEVGAERLAALDAGHLVFVGTNGPAFPIALFAAARAGIPLVPLNYRQTPEQIAALIADLEHPVIVHDPALASLVADVDAPAMTTDSFATSVPDAWSEGPPAPSNGDPDATALLLFTSGTTAAPKAAVLRHRHLAAYVMTTVEFSNADEDAASLVSVPPYHIAGVSNTITNLYAGRRVVHLANFDPAAWLDLATRESVTHALIVPTMLSRIVDHLDATGTMPPPQLRTLAYGGAPMPATVIERALGHFPDTDFVNAYGLTETSSTISVLGPDEHRDALASDDPAVRARLGSAGVVVPGIEIEIRDDAGDLVGAGQTGDLWVRGEQVSGEYRGLGATVDEAGWFATRDRAWVDDDGYLFIEGRADDTIIRGGENIAPAEIEEVLRRHGGVADAAVVGLPDEEWGQRIAAAVVTRPGATPTETQLTDFVRAALRSAKAPEEIRFVDELPLTDTGKLVRRDVVAQFLASEGTTP